MLLNEIETAKRIGLGHLSPIKQKKRVRKMIREAKIQPQEFDGGRTWMIGEHLLEILIECPLKRSKGAGSGTRGGRKTANPSSSLQEFFTPVE